MISIGVLLCFHVGEFTWPDIFHSSMYMFDLFICTMPSGDNG